jgi:3D (Asp-Asp-Asp) domain-containing protein
MKKIMLFAALAAAIGYYCLPVLIASAGGSDVSLTPTIEPNTVETLYLRVTAYSSSIDETDNTPFITATGDHVHDGIVATNLLPFETRVEIPALFGDKIFTVDDRMNAKMAHNIDIWMPSKEQALRFGVSYAEVVVVTSVAAIMAPNPTVAYAK